MTRSERLKRYCEGRTKKFVGVRRLGIPAEFAGPMMTYLSKIDIDDLIQRIDALEVENETKVELPRRRGRAA